MKPKKGRKEGTLLDSSCFIFFHKWVDEGREAYTVLDVQHTVITEKCERCGASRTKTVIEGGTS